MKRTTKPKSRSSGPTKKRMINYYDKNRAQRWGELEEEGKNHIIVRDTYGGRVKVPREKIIEEKEILEEF